MGTLPRNLSTTPWYLPRNTDTPPLSQQQQQQEQQQQQQQLQQQPSPSATRLPTPERNQDGSNRKHVELYPNLVTRSEHLKDVAIGKVVDNTVRIDDYFEALEAWMELAARERQHRDAKTRGGLEAACHAHALLKSLDDTLDPKRAKSALLRPTASLYDVVLQAYAVCGGGMVAAMKAQKLLEHMLANVRATLHELPPRLTPYYPEPSINSFNHVLTCWAGIKCKDSDTRPEWVLSQMEEWRRDCHLALQRDPSFPYRGCYPTTTTVCALIRALKTEKGSHTPDRAWQLLQEVVEAQRNPSIPKHRFHNVRLEPKLFKSVISKWVRSGRSREGATKAEEILSLAAELHDEGLMEKLPCKRMYALVLHAWAKCEDSTGDSAQRAHDILVNMISLYRQGVPVEFNVVAFGTCVAAWSRCANLNDAPEKAEEILKELLSLHEETGLVDFQPDLVLWHVMQTVWLNATERADSMDRCAEIIQRMQKHGCQPTTQSYGLVLNAAGRRGLGDHAQTLLQQYALDFNVSLLRDIRCVNGVLEALAREARDDSMDRAMAFFEKMKCQDIFANPDSYSYAILLDALSRCGGWQQAERGRDLLEDMMQRCQQGDTSCRPNTRVVSGVLKLCACTNGTDNDRRRALDIALEIFWKCKSYFGVWPNHLVHIAMLHTINRLVASENRRSERLEVLENVFEECRARGEVSVAAVTAMREGGASHCLSRLTASCCRRVPHQYRPTLEGVLLEDTDARYIG